MNEEAKLTTKLLPLKETEINERAEDEIDDSKTKNSLDSLQSSNSKYYYPIWLS